MPRLLSVLSFTRYDKIVEVHSNSIAGVLLLQHHQLKKKEQDALAHTLEHSSKSVCADPALSVPVTAAVWMIANQEDIRQSCDSKKVVENPSS